MMATLEMIPLEVGHELHGWRRVITHERALWYGGGLSTAVAGERRDAWTNIHTDEEFARNQGFTTAVADGMHSTNWISSMLFRKFGAAYLVAGELRTKYVRPTIVGTLIAVRGTVTSKAEEADGSVRYTLDVWTEDESGERLTVGDAAVVVAAVRRG